MNLREIDVDLTNAVTDPTEIPGTEGQPISDFRVVELGAADVTLRLGQSGNAVHPYVNFGLENLCPRHIAGLWFTNPTATPGGLLRLHVLVDGGATLSAS